MAEHPVAAAVAPIGAEKALDAAQPVDGVEETLEVLVRTFLYFTLCLSCAVELGEDDVGGAEGAVDVLVGGADGVGAELDGAHGGVERGEAAVEGAEDGDDGVGGRLALPERLPQQRRALRQALHPLALARSWCSPAEERSKGRARSDARSGSGGGGGGPIPGPWVGCAQRRGEEQVDGGRGGWAGLAEEAMARGEGEGEGE